jgi:hypothetical protein
MKLSEQITTDLMTKCADDVSRVLTRTMSIAPRPYLPIFMNAGAVCAGMMAAELHHLGGGERNPGDVPDAECILLAGLLIARAGISGTDPIGDAYKDFAALKAAGRLALGKAP